jgi:hypothetical protein
MPTLPSRSAFRGLLRIFAACCRLARAIGIAPAGPGAPSSPNRPDNFGTEAARPSSTARLYLLRTRLASLGIDPDELTGSYPLLFERLEARCSSCESPEKCARELANGLVEEGSQEWRDYCRNAGTLRMVSAVQTARRDRTQRRRPSGTTKL